jgi:hypothetical protein
MKYMGTIRDTRRYHQSVMVKFFNEAIFKNIGYANKKPVNVKKPSTANGPNNNGINDG